MHCRIQYIDCSLIYILQMASLDFLTAIAVFLDRR